MSLFAWHRHRWSPWMVIRVRLASGALANAQERHCLDETCNRTQRDIL